MSEIIPLACWEDADQTRLWFDDGVSQWSGVTEGGCPSIWERVMALVETEKLSVRAYDGTPPPTRGVA